ADSAGRRPAATDNPPPLKVPSRQLSWWQAIGASSVRQAAHSRSSSKNVHEHRFATTSLMHLHTVVGGARFRRALTSVHCKSGLDGVSPHQVHVVEKPIS